MPISLILLVAAIVMLAINGSATLQLFAYLTGGKNLDSIPKSEMYDVIASSEINAVYDCFAEYETAAARFMTIMSFLMGKKDLSLSASMRARLTRWTASATILGKFFLEIPNH